MAVDVAPVMHGFVAQPRQGRERRETVAGTKQDHAAVDGRKSEKIDFVFGDENPVDRRIEFGQTGRVEAEVGSGQQERRGSQRVKKTAAQAFRFFAKAITTVEAIDAAGAGIDGRGRQDEVEQFRQQPSVGFDKFAVDTG